MNRVICTTSIYPPSEATLKFAEMKDWKLVIAGDLKTPHAEYVRLASEFSNVHYLHPLTQDGYDVRLSDAIGWNCIQRRNFAFLYACKELNAEILASVDDDNIPRSGWGDNLTIRKHGRYTQWNPDSEVFDPFWVATLNTKAWHRGFPLELLKHRACNPEQIEFAPDIQADFWSGECDVDAICRMEHNTCDIPYQTVVFPFTSNKPSPFNSQNTFLHKDVMPHYFMHCDVGRYDDILAAYYVQSKGFRVVYGKPSVRQERNEHDVMKDFANEIWGYQNILQVIRDLKANPDNIWNWLNPRASEAFRLYQKHFE